MNTADVFTAVLVTCALLIGCGPSQAEWQDTQNQVVQLKADLADANKRHDEDVRNYEAAQRQIAYLKAKVSELGSELAASAASTSPQPAPPPSATATDAPLGWVPLGTQEDHRCVADLSMQISSTQLKSAFFKKVWRSKTECPKQRFREDDIKYFVDCAQRTLTPCDAIHYGWDGTPVNDPGCSPPQTVFPDTVGEGIWNFVCGQP